MNMTDVHVHDFYTFLLVFARIAGVMTAAPMFGNRAIPKTAKAGMALFFSLAVVPLVSAKTGPIPTHLLVLAGAVLKDAVFGLALGYLAQLLFAAVELAGALTDTMMGFGFVNLINPFAEQQASIMGMFQYQLAIVLYLLANGHLMMLATLVRSFDAMPPGAIVVQSGFSLTVLAILKAMFILGIRLALPAIGVLLVVDMAFGMVARMVPQVNVFIVGMPVKILVGLITAAFILPLTALVVGQILSGTAVGMNALLGQ